MKPGDLLTAEEVAAICRCSTRQARRHMKMMQRYDLGRRLLVTRAALDRYLNSKAKGPETETELVFVKQARLRSRIGKPLAHNSVMQRLLIPIQPRTKPKR